MKMKILNRENFKAEVTEQSGPVLVDFWAPWCGYCRRLNPVLDVLAEEYGELLVVKLNIDEAEEISDGYGVETIPTLILFRDGKPGNPLIAPTSMDEIVVWLRLQRVEKRI